jgi:hypothetical protein
MDPLEKTTWETLPKPVSLPTEQNPTASDKWGQYRDVPKLYNRSISPPSNKNRQEKTRNCVQVARFPRITAGLLANPEGSLSAVDTEGYEQPSVSDKRSDLPCQMRAFTQESFGKNLLKKLG